MYTYILHNIVYTNTSNSIPFYIQGVPEACVSVKRLLNTKLFPYHIRIILPPFLVAREYFFFFFGKFPGEPENCFFWIENTVGPPEKTSLICSLHHTENQKVPEKITEICWIKTIKEIQKDLKIHHKNVSSKCTWTRKSITWLSTC